MDILQGNIVSYLQSTLVPTGWHSGAMPWLVWRATLSHRPFFHRAAVWGSRDSWDTRDLVWRTWDTEYYFNKHLTACTGRSPFKASVVSAHPLKGDFHKKHHLLMAHWVRAPSLRHTLYIIATTCKWMKQINVRKNYLPLLSTYI